MVLPLVIGGLLVKEALSGDKSAEEQEADRLGIEVEELRRRKQEERQQRVDLERRQRAATIAGGAERGAERAAYASEVQGRTTPNMAPAEQASSVGVWRNSGRVDRGDVRQGDEFRTGQQQLAGNYWDTISGKVPSVAEMQLAKARDRNMADLMAAQAAARGMPGGAARQRALQSQLATTGQQAASDAALLRAQEVEAARQGLTGLLGTARAGDMALRSQDVQIALQDAQLRQAAEQFGAAAQNAASLQAAGFQQDAAKVNAQLALMAEQMRDSLRLKLIEMGYNEAEADRQARLAVEGMFLQQSTASDATAEQRRQSDLQDDITLSDFLPATTQSDRRSKTGIQLVSDANAKTDIMSADDPETEFLKRFNEGLTETMSGGGGVAGGVAKAATGRDIDWTGATGFANTPMQKAAIDSQGDVPWSLTGLLAGGQRHAMSGIPGANKSIDEIMAKTGAYGANPLLDAFQRNSAAAGAGQLRVAGQGLKTSPAAMTMSDRSSKDIQRMAPVDKFLDALAAYTYSYKEPERHGDGERLGVMAQDLERTRLGEGLVNETSDGKRIDVGGLANAAMASVVSLHDRIKALEKSVGKGKQRGKQKRKGDE